MQKRFFILLLGTFSLGCMFAQHEKYDVRLTGTMAKTYDFTLKKQNSPVDIVEKGQKVDITNVYHDFGNKSCYVQMNGVTRPLFDEIENVISFDCKSKQEFWNAQILCKVLVYLQKKGIQYDLRSDMEADVVEYLSRISEYNMELDDPCLKNYIHGLMLKIAPSYYIDSRPNGLDVLVLKDPTADACMYPNGTLVINTGLLSCLHTEDELVAVLSHEIAHFVLDHSVQNVSKEITRQKRAEFWTTVLTEATAVAETVAVLKGKNDMPGLATETVAILSSVISQKVIDRLGMKYNRKQEEEADGIALQMLSFLGYDHNALAIALDRICETIVAERNFAAGEASYTHPELSKRIEKAGKTDERKEDAHFDRRMSSAVSVTALINFYSNRYKRALDLVSQNISRKIALPEDYLLKANCLLRMYDDKETYSQVLHLINSAKKIDPENLNSYKLEILTSLRMGDEARAASLLGEYMNLLGRQGKGAFLTSEMQWCRNMLFKLKCMDEESKTD